jgi:hypothetical protein
MRSIPQTSRSGSDLTAAGGHKGGIVCGGAKPNWNGPRCTPGVSWSLSWPRSLQWGMGLGRKRGV